MKRFAFAILLLAGCAKRDTVNTVTEQVETVLFRTELRHAGCKGFWRASGYPERITAYGIDKSVWPHVCSACGQTNRLYDARWPQFRREWRTVK